MPVPTPFGPGLIGPMDDRLWNVLKKLAGQSVTFAEPSIENALVAGSVGSNLKPSGIRWDPGAEALLFGPGGFVLKGIPYENALVESLNGLSGDVTLAAGSNITLTPSGQTVTIAAQGGTNQILFASTSSRTVTNTTTQVSLVGSGVGDMHIPANFFTLGRVIRFKLVGYCKSSANSDLILALNFGGVTLSTLTVSPWPTTGGANQTFTAEALVTCRSIGASGQFIGNFTATQTPNPSGAPVVYANPVTAQITVDTTSAVLLDLTYKQNTGSSTESITSTNVTMEAM